jgi:hypothetical protein
MVEIIVRHVDRSKGHISVDEVLRDGGTRRVQGQNNQEGYWKEESKKHVSPKQCFQTFLP